MDKNNKKASKEFASNFKHPAGGYYHEGQKGRQDPGKGLTPRQRKTQRKKPRTSGYNMRDVG